MKINPRQLEKIARKMGMQMASIPAEEVIIKTADKDIVISNPEVSRVKMAGQESFQISGEVSEHEKSAYNEDDVKMVIEKTGAAREDVEKVLKETNGDLAEAILKLKK